MTSMSTVAAPATTEPQMIASFESSFAATQSAFRALLPAEPAPERDLPAAVLSEIEAQAARLAILACTDATTDAEDAATYAGHVARLSAAYCGAGRAA